MPNALTWVDHLSHKSAVVLMDHLLSNQTRQLGYWVRVPYLGKDPESAPQTSDFFTFAANNEYFEDGALDLGLASPDKAAAILQQWLYFGFLREFCLVQDIVFADKCFTLTTPENDKVLHTFGLPGLIRHWEEKEEVRPRETNSQAERFGKVKKVLGYLRQNVRAIDARPGAEVYNIVLASIQVLGYTITNALKFRFPEAFLGFHPGFGSPQVFIDRLASRKWCPRDVAMLANEFFPDTQFYCTMISPPRKEFSHVDCSDAECKAMNIDESTYRTQHVSQGCTCAFLEAPVKPLHRLVDRLVIPAVRYEAGSISIAELNKDEANVVFSHVWADGLGNVSGKNALPTCQIVRLQEVADMAFNMGESRPVAFYIDTLCVPRDMVFRRQAIRKMKDVYTNAMKVVVLDREIEALSSNDTIAQKVVRIHFSGWMRRLWTYQEGALNKSLFFKLSDHILPFDSMRPWFWEVHDTAEAGCVKTPLSLFIKTLDVQDPQAVPPALFFAIARDALHWRSTSRPEDEAVVLAILLGYDTETLLKAEGTERMKLILQRVGKVPLALALLSGQRMEEEGYSWAPKSFLALKGHSMADALDMWYSSMLRINPKLSEGEFHNEVHVANVLGTGALCCRPKGYAIYPCGPANDPIPSPVWFMEVKAFEDKSRTPMVENCWRVNFQEDLKGVPEALPQEVFFLVPVEEPRNTLLGEISTMSAFIALGSREVRDFVSQHFFDEQLSLDTIPCRFYCRVRVSVMTYAYSQTQRVWRSELFKDSIPNAHLVRPIESQEWIIS